MRYRVTDTIVEIAKDLTSLAESLLLSVALLLVVYIFLGDDDLKK